MNIDEALQVISTDKKDKVKNVFEELFSYYGDIIVTKEEAEMSEFFRDVIFQVPILAKPRIVISNSCDYESALIHELLHLHLPFKYRTYTFWFPNLTEDLNVISNHIQNVVEHDLMITQFLEFGYDIVLFLKNPYINIDYKKEGKENNDKIYWLFEYLRHLINMKHLPAKKVEENRKSMTRAREFAIKRYPSITEDFKEIREWVNSKKFHDPNLYPIELVKLFRIFGVTAPQKYLRPTINSQLEQEFIS